MKKYSNIAVILVVFSLFSVSCAKKEVFRLDVSKSRKATVLREMNVKVAVTVSVPVSETEMKVSTVETVNKLETTAETLLDLQNPEKPGLFESSEKIVSANFHVSQKQDDDEKSITMSYDDGKIAVVDKKGDPEGRFEASARQSLSAMIKQSEIKALMDIDSKGEIKNIVAPASLKKSLELNFEKSSGIFGVTFPEKAVKVGDSWIAKRTIKDVEGIDISKNPIELVIKSKREKDEKVNEKEFAVFKSSYSIDKKNISGIFGGFPVTVDIEDAGVTINHFDKQKKVFVHTIANTKTKVTSSQSSKSEDSSLKLDIENSSRTVTVGI
jgi:hypothetical protein